jgi:hypothetical protein
LHLDRFEQPAEKRKTACLRGPILRTGTPNAEALAAAYLEYASLGPRVPIRRMGGAAWHLDRFEQPG